MKSSDYRRFENEDMKQPVGFILSSLSESTVVFCILNNSRK